MPETISKPIVKDPVDGNIFSVVGACTRALKKAGQNDNADKLTERVFTAIWVLNSESYNKALAICMEYVTFDL
jgi:hypothetical protein